MLSKRDVNEIESSFQKYANLTIFVLSNFIAMVSKSLEVKKTFEKTFLKLREDYFSCFKPVSSLKKTRKPKNTLISPLVCQTTMNSGTRAEITNYFHFNGNFIKTLMEWTTFLMHAACTIAQKGFLTIKRKKFFLKKEFFLHFFSSNLSSFF